MSDPIDQAAFDALEAQGFHSEYIEIDVNKVWHPAVTLEQALEMGFFPKGTKVRWVDHNGYPGERDRARQTFTPDQILIVQACFIGRSSSSYQFEGIASCWNSVMFEKIEEE